MTNADASSVVNGATTAPDSGVSSTTPVQSGTPSSATTKNIGRGGQNAQVSQSNSYGDDWWKEHQEGIFKHPRFKELTEYKQKYSQAEPLVQFAEQMGGLEQIQGLYQYFGPVYSRFMEMIQENPQGAQQAWSQLLPYLQAVITGQPFPGAQQASPQMEEPVDNSYDEDPKFKMLQDELEQLKRRDAMRSENEIRQSQQNNFNKYLNLFESRVKDMNIPQPLAQLLHDRIANSIAKYMPRDPRSGRQIGALDVFSEPAFLQCWEKEIEPLYKQITGSVLDKSKATTESGGPVIPDTNVHGKSAANLAPRIRSRSERLAAMTAQIQNFRR